MPRRLVLGGYLGSGNLGDDAVMTGLLAALGDEFSPVILSGDPGATFLDHGLHAVHRRKPAMVREALSEAEALVYAGGSVFQDVSSWRSIVHYWMEIRTAARMRRRIALVGQGVGPLRSPISRVLAADAFRRAHAVTVRDPGSLELLKKLRVRGAELGADSAFLLPPPTRSAFDPRRVALAPRPIAGVDVETLFADVARGLVARGMELELLALDRTHDIGLVRAIALAAGLDEPADLRTPLLVRDRIADAALCVAIRLHAGILAATAAVPSIMLDYDPKVAAFADLAGTGPAVPKAEWTADAILARIDAALPERADRSARVAAATAKLRTAAEVNADAVRRATESSSLPERRKG